MSQRRSSSENLPSSSLRPLLGSHSLSQNGFILTPSRAAASRGPLILNDPGSNGLNSEIHGQIHMSVDLITVAGSRRTSTGDNIAIPIPNLPVPTPTVFGRSSVSANDS